MAKNDTDDSSSLDRIYDDIVRRYEEELASKEVLESKAVSFLGFIGVFLAVLTSVSTVQIQNNSLARDDLESTFAIIAAPLGLQVVAAALLFFVIWGFGVLVGPNLIQVFKNRGKPCDWVTQGLLAGYCESILSNRMFLMRRVLYFRLAVMCVAVSIGQLTLSVAASSLDLGWEVPNMLEQAVFMAPAFGVSILGFFWISLEHENLRKELANDLAKWHVVRENEGGKEDGKSR